MKTGLVMEGGAMRGMFTAGVIDVFMENGIEFDGGIGVSAGATFGCNYKSHQIGRPIRYNKKYCQDRRYVSFRGWLKTGDLYGPEFDYVELPNKLDIFDVETYKSNPMDFYAVATDAYTGEPVYKLINNGDAYDIQWIRASASMPVFANPVMIDGVEYSDGGTSDSVPLKYFESIGYDRNVVILTKPKGYRKKPYAGKAFIRTYLRKYPELYNAMLRRHIMYNSEMDYIDACEAAGKIIAIRPDAKLKMKQWERDPHILEEAYQLGRKKGEQYKDAVKEFLRG